VSRLRLTIGLFFGGFATKNNPILFRSAVALQPSSDMIIT
jgi:hypothetical protein